MNQLEVAALGTGTIAETHLAAWSMHPNAKIRGLWSKNAKKAKDLAEKYKAKAYRDVEELVADERVNVVDICLPPSAHRDAAVQAAKAGKHVLCEVPIALRLQDADEMLDAARKANVKFMAAHQLRFYPQYVGGYSGNVNWAVVGQARVIRAYWLTSYQKWVQELEADGRDGGVIINAGIHYVDLLRSVLKSEVKRAFAYVSPPVLKEAGVQDHAYLLLKFENDAVAYIEASWAMPPTKLPATFMDITGTKGILTDRTIDAQENTAPVIIATWSRIERHTPRHPVWFTLSDESYSYSLEVEHFANCILEDKVPAVTGEDARKSLEACLAAERSASTGGPVALPMEAS